MRIDEDDTRPGNAPSRIRTGKHPRYGLRTRTSGTIFQNSATSRHASLRHWSDNDFRPDGTRKWGARRDVKSPDNETHQTDATRQEINQLRSCTPRSRRGETNTCALTKTPNGLATRHPASALESVLDTALERIPVAPFFKTVPPAN